MNIYALSSLTALILNVAIGLFVYFKNRQGMNNRYFMYVTMVLSAWILGCFMESSVVTKESALFWDRILYTGIILWPSFYIKFIHNFLNKKATKILKICWLISGIFLIFNFVSPLRYYLLTDVVKKYTFRFIGVPGFLWYLVTLYIIWSCTVGVILSFLEYRKSVGPRRTQMKYFMTGQIIISIAGAMYFLLLLNVITPPIDNFLVVVYGTIMAYAIVRHQLLEIEVIIKKTLVFAGLFASSFAILVLPTLIIQEFIVGKMNLGGRITGLGIGAALIILILRPLENFLINITDKYLFQKGYDYKKLLKTFTGEVLTVLDINRLTKLTAYKLADIIKLVSCGVLLFDEEKDGFTLAASYGIKEKNIFLGKENTLATFMERTRAYLSIEHQGEDSPLPKKIIRDMNILKVELAIPLVLHSKMIGILTLGKKKSDEGYTQDDVDILLPLARTLAIAIGNAELFDELSKTQAEAAQREKMAVIGTLSAGINHEICNPLGIVRGQCEAFMLNLKDGLYKNKSEKELLEKAIDIMKKSIKEVDRATAVTKRLSTFAKPIKEIKVDEVKVRDEINEVMALVGHELRLEKIEVIQEIPDDLPDIIADRKQIEEIFFNLIRNAGQAIGEEGRITIRAKFNGNNKVLIEIEDTGHGIPENKIEQIFNPFYTTKEPGKGTGLGLFIVRQVIEKNKGKISVRSKIGVGTTFTLEFPAATKVEV